MKYLEVRKGGPHAKKYLTPHQITLLKTIKEHGETYAYHLIKEHEYAEGTISKLLSNLETEGFIRSQPKEGKSIYSLAPKGEDIADNYHSIDDVEFKAVVPEKMNGRLINMGYANTQLVLRSNYAFVRSELPVSQSIFFSFNTSVTIQAKAKEGQTFIIFG